MWCDLTADEPVHKALSSKDVVRARVVLGSVHFEGGKTRVAHICVHTRP